ncbi:hypothetical protein [Chryseobacterium carnipullorum]|uniref:Uncharacterized protein n=2 Tax=Chryseobacterium carnipullorum TaxID=1124835 RepID=A0A376EPX4_CHRCU|nr:hypothetical protein [Chryseobacterium carnipullorum]AZA67104.1 hypothetical protein EG345_22225 [Chryseobacterium carnipullorum]STD11924.1 Uncharacterised protein [Chryseobacterium carnipullorum]
MNFKTKIVMILLSSLLITNCKEEMKKCVSQSTDTNVKLYNDLTDQLMPYFFREDYLGEKRYFDSLRVHDDDLYIEEKTKAHNELFNHPEKFCNLYIDSTKNKNTYFWTHNTEVYLRRIKRTKDSFKDFSNNPDIKNLSIRSSIKANQFNLCTAKVLDLVEYDKHTNECEIGVVYFSEIVFDPSKRRALVFVDHRIKNYFHRNAVFELRLNNDNYWEIEDSMLVSTS